MSNYPRDLLQRFTTANHNHQHQHHHLPFPAVKVDEDEHEIDELSLGLSMNGRFGVDPTAKKIKRTTSIPEFMNPVMRREEEVGYVVPMNCTTNLIRTCSLPTETEDEWRRRKELQTLRRMEARRKRSEKQRNLKAMRERNRGFNNSEENGSEEGNNFLMEQGCGADEFNGLRRTTSLTARVGGLGLNGEKENGGGLPPPSIGSSHRTGSSVISEFECQQGQVSNILSNYGSSVDLDYFGKIMCRVSADRPIMAELCPLWTESVSCFVDSRSPIGANSCDNEQKSPAMTVRNLSNNHSSPENKTKNTVRNLLEDMPCVSTKGDGPNGKKVEGFLYRYGKGEEVRIVCVCHGSFLTPAEFVKHAGGSDVTNPLKHIVVSPSML
ncbi:hypothetical protein RIF29_14364 [Crotalaria pallida]|uniref:Ninja-family protein n=1 Tax=Crotalaria pallida TaxID=3830 RepID=A0AAN9FGY0_CROPI